MAQSREIIASSVKQPLDTRRAASRSTRHHKRTTTVEFVTHCLPCAVATMALRHYPHCGRRVVIVETGVCRDADETSAVFRDEGVSGEEAWGRRGRGRRRGRRGGVSVMELFFACGSGVADDEQVHDFPVVCQPRAETKTSSHSI